MMNACLLLLVCVCAVGSSTGTYYRRPRIPCPSVAIGNGRMRFRQKSGFAHFQCYKGYLLAGEKYSRCVNGQWDSPRPKCVRASCQKIKAPANGLIHPSHRGAVLNFFCRSGYNLHGPNMTSCNGRAWDSYLPTCLPTDEMPSLSCDFETDNLCGWSHDLNHNFDWTRMNFKTPSSHIGTGPAYDHTKGENGNGYYMYIESSSRNVNDTARLISPVYERQENDTCLEFYYHMYGMTTGQLRVYLKKASDQWTFNPESAIFWKSGNHGNLWLRSMLRIGAVSEDFQIIFEGVRGASYISDIAIDDVRLIENCAAEDDVTTTTESEAYTDAAIAFESCSNRCGTSSSTTSSDEFQIGCDCDDYCAERSSCCPDYVAICILNELSTDADLTTQSEDNATKIRPPTTTALSPTMYVTTVSTTIAMTTTTTTKQATTSTSTTKRQTMPVATTVVATSSTRRITTPTIKTTRKQTTTTETAEPPPPEKIDETTKIIDDIATVPETIDKEWVTIVATETYESMDSEKAATIKEKPKGVATSIIIAVVSVCLVCGVLFAVFMARRYSRNSCLRITKMKSGSGDSQSDVRFLTSDEILDFTLAT